MTAGGLYQASIHSKIAFASCCLVAQDRRSSPEMVSVLWVAAPFSAATILSEIVGMRPRGRFTGAVAATFITSEGAAAPRLCLEKIIWPGGASP